MKFLNLIFCLLAFATTNIVAQTPTDFITGLNNPRDLIVHDNKLYIAEYGSNKILVVDLTTTTPTATDFVTTGLTDPRYLQVIDDTLYVLERRAGGKLHQIDLTANTPIVDTLFEVEEGVYPTGLAHRGRVLYISQFLNSTPGIYTFDTALEAPSLTLYFGSEESPDNLYVHDDYLYFDAITTSVAKRIDLTASPVVANRLGSSVYGYNDLAVYGNLLFSCKTKFIRYFNLDVIPLVETSYYSLNNNNNIRNLMISGGVLYASVGETGKILSFNLENELSTPQFGALGLSLVANPVGDVLELTPQVPAQTPYVIYSLLGAEVQSGVINSQGNIALPSLTKGMYLLRIQNQPTLRFIKP